jgi:hypothetical protein
MPEHTCEYLECLRHRSGSSSRERFGVFVHIQTWINDKIFKSFVPARINSMNFLVYRNNEVRNNIGIILPAELTLSIQDHLCGQQS